MIIINQFSAPKMIAAQESNETQKAHKNIYCCRRFLE